ncbi:MAG: hypothetical protein GKS00_23545 [Alphaproteobacteria bacterium]|nr:hypothetical protein [Alphaproteobacteria bacterium]
MITEPCWFLVTSIGRTATYWLAWSLNRHPDILCSHGDHFPPDIVSLGEDGQAELELSSVGNPIRSFYDIPDFQTLGMDQKKMRRGQTIFQQKTIDDVLDAHRMFGDYAAIGNVHGYSMGNFANRYNAGQAKRKIGTANLIRNPVGQILSFYRRHSFDAERSDEYKLSRFKIVERNIEFAVAIRERFDIDIEDHDTMIFLSTVIDVTVMQKDILIKDVLHMPYEELTRSQDAFSILLRLITGDADIAIEQSYLDDVFAQGPMNYSSGQEPAVKEAFDALAHWKKFVIAKLLSEDVVHRYSEYGYQLNFLSDRIEAQK